MKERFQAGPANCKKTIWEIYDHKTKEVICEGPLSNMAVIATALNRFQKKGNKNSLPLK